MKLVTITTRVIQLVGEETANKKKIAFLKDSYHKGKIIIGSFFDKIFGYVYISLKDTCNNSYQNVGGILQRITQE